MKGSTSVPRPSVLVKAAAITSNLLAASAGTILSHSCWTDAIRGVCAGIAWPMLMVQSAATSGGAWQSAGRLPWRQYASGLRRRGKARKDSVAGAQVRHAFSGKGWGATDRGPVADRDQVAVLLSELLPSVRRAGRTAAVLSAGLADGGDPAAVLRMGQASRPVPLSSFSATPVAPTRRAAATSQASLRAATSDVSPPRPWMFDTQLRALSRRPTRGCSVK